MSGAEIHRELCTVYDQNAQTSARKLMEAVFWDRKEMLVVELMLQRTTITPEVYCETLKICIGPFRTKVTEC
jgi:hypothetical protein